jgi:hypothetical protein
MRRLAVVALFTSCWLAVAGSASRDSIGWIEFPITPFSNMESGFQATDPGFRAFIKAADGKTFVAGGPLTMDAVMAGRSDDASQGSAYGKLILHMSEAVFPMLAHRQASRGTNHGYLSICMAADTNAPINQTTCKSIGGNESDRPFQVIDKEIDYTFDAAGNITITKYYGSTGDGGTETQLSLAVFHPAFGFAAPGKAFKDYQSPLVLDLDHNGQLDLVNVWDDQRPISFDLNGTGSRVRTGWVKGTDGLLFIDNGTGCVTDGTQFLGEYTGAVAGKRTFRNGFEALARKFDPQGTGRVVVAEHPELMIWRNTAQDGVCKKSEVFPASRFVREIAVGYQVVPDVKLTEDNEIRLTGTYLGTDGVNHLVGDVWFKQRRHAVASRD